MKKHTDEHELVQSPDWDDDMYLCEEEEKKPSFINELVRGIKNPLKGVTKYEP